MRLAIASDDRVGIAQEILAVFANKGWDLLVMEVSQYHTYLQLKDDDLALSTIKPELDKIAGIQTVQQIELLPGERKSQQLQVLLARIPDPIIDIDKNGIILVANKAAAQTLGLTEEELIAKPLSDFVDQRLRIYLTGQSTTQEITFANKQYFADITPVKSENTINGAVIVLRSLSNVGRHLSHLQKGQHSSFDSIIGQSAQITAVINQAKRFASLDMPVLIKGDTGTGKELLARALHDNGNRASKPFLAINCAALSEHLLESELFGYASGAFTGAQSGGKPGLFELADGGTVFLDEIAEMPVYLQAKLLRFLQDFKLRRVGGLSDRKVNVRIISASHQNLNQGNQAIKFREDLYYRLNVLSLSLPSLTQRKDDIPLLVNHFIQNAAMQVNQTEMTITGPAMNKLIQYSWPGNIRQLQNLLFRVVALADSREINEQQLRFDDEPSNDQQVYFDYKSDQVGNWEQAQQQFEQQLLADLLPLYPSTRKLAERLQVSHNKIAMKLRRYKIK